MGRYEGIKIRVSIHGYKQYCDRVGIMDYPELNEMCQKQLDEGDYGYNRKDFIHLSGVWWVYEVTGMTMTLVTCYGKTTMDVPRALAWASRHKDRLNLSYSIGTNDGVETL